MISAFSLVKQQWESTPQLLHFFWLLRFSAFGVSSTHRTDWHDYNQQEEDAVSKVNVRPVAVSGCLRGRGRTNKKGSSTRTVVHPLPGLSGTHRALLHVFLHTGRQRAQLLFTIRHFHVLFLNGDAREGDVCCILQAHNYFFLADKSFNTNCSAFNVTCFYFVYLTASFSSIETTTFWEEQHFVSSRIQTHKQNCNKCNLESFVTLHLHYATLLSVGEPSPLCYLHGSVSETGLTLHRRSIQPEKHEDSKYI